jgi:prenyltransferase beta subunit
MAWPSKARALLCVERSWAPGLAVCVSLLVLGACPALATPNNELNKKRLESTVRFLQNAQNSDGGFSANGNVGEASNPDFTAWAAIALACAGINPEDQAKPGGESAYSYLVAHTGELKVTTDFERVLLVVDAAGTSAQGFGRNLIGSILGRQLGEGGFSHEGSQTPTINDTIFAILSLSPVQEREVQEAVKRAVGWLERQQNPDGSWPSTAGDGAPGNVDITAAAIEALNAAGVHDSEAQGKALEYLREAQRPDGGFPEFTVESESDTASTSWTVQAIVSAGENPETWRQASSGKEPLGYLESMQHEDGSIQSSAGSDENPVWMTAYAAPAFSLQPLPPPAVPLEVPSSTPPGPVGGTPAANGTAETGQGGESSQPGSGVIAGGGGRGAPLFSRPQPQSQGRTPGGVRLLDSARESASPASTARHARQRPLRDPPSVVATITTVSSAKPASSASADHHKGSGSAAMGSGDGGQRAGGGAIRGLLINAPGSKQANEVLEPGAPGLRGAGAGGGQTPWLAIAIGGLIVLLIVVGSQLERRRPQVIV